MQEHVSVHFHYSILLLIVRSDILADILANTFQTTSQKNIIPAASDKIERFRDIPATDKHNCPTQLTVRTK